MNIFAHRGVFDIYPENSFRALKYALDNNFSIETDLRLTKDGNFIIIHDETLKRLCGKDIPVSALTLEDLRQQYYIDTNVGQLEDKFISFREYCELFVKTPLEILTAVQVKADSQTEHGLNKISNYFEEFNLYEKAFIFDLTLKAATQMRKINPKIKIGLIISEYRFEPTIYLWSEIKNFDFDIVWAGEYRKLYNKKWFEEVKRTGRALYAMSPDVHKASHILHPRAYKGYEKTWKDLIRWGAEGVCTDLPFEFRKFERYIKR